MQKESIGALKNTKAADDESWLLIEGCFRILPSTKETLQLLKLLQENRRKINYMIVKDETMTKQREREDLMKTGI